jgi:hypothetical protein
MEEEWLPETFSPQDIAKFAQASLRKRLLEEQDC